MSGIFGKIIREDVEVARLSFDVTSVGMNRAGSAGGVGL